MAESYMRVKVQITEQPEVGTQHYSYPGLLGQKRVNVSSTIELKVGQRYDCVVTDWRDDGSPRAVKPLSQLYETEKLQIAALHNRRYSVKDIAGADEFDGIIEREGKGEKPKQLQLIAFAGSWSLNPEQQEYGGHLKNGRFKVRRRFSGMMPELEGRLIPYVYSGMHRNYDGTLVVFVAPAPHILKKLEEEKRDYYKKELSDLVKKANERLNQFDLDAFRTLKEEYKTLMGKAFDDYQFYVRELPEAIDMCILSQRCGLIEALTQLEDVFIKQSLIYDFGLAGRISSKNPDQPEGTPLGFFNHRLLRQLASTQELKEKESVRNYLNMVWGALTYILDIGNKFNLDLTFNHYGPRERRDMPKLFRRLPIEVLRAGIDLEEMVLRRDEALSELSRATGQPMQAAIDIGYHILDKGKKWFFGSGWKNIVAEVMKDLENPQQ